MTRTLPLLWTLALTAAALFGLLAGCEKSADRQHLDNPFDPAGPLGGDGLQIRAIASPNQIVLTWNQPQNMGISEYILYKSESPNGPTEQLAIVAQTTATTGSYIYSYPDPTRTLWFRAQAFTAGGDFTITSLAVPASAAVGPTIIVGDTVSSLATRYPEFAVTVGFGDSLLIGFDDDYSDSIRVPVAGPDLPTVFSLDLGAATAADTFVLHVKSWDSLGESLPTVMRLPVTFAPRQRVIGASPLQLIRRVIDLSIPATGVVQMRFAASTAALAAAPWVPGAAIYEDYELSDSANSQDIWGEFVSDFGFSTTNKLTVRPDLLGSATFKLLLPSNRVVSTRYLVAQSTAKATQLRISESPNFAAVPWQTYADTLTFEISAAEGTKTIYAQYRNDWAESAILTDFCTYVAQGADVRIFAPGEGDVVVGGSTLQVRGTASAGTGFANLDSVRVDFGDGLGFREVVGTENWQLNWNVPVFAADTPLVLRARAWADSVVVTDVVNVTVTQLAVAILSPLDGASVAGGSTVTISGTAVGELGGAPVDSVVVDVGGLHFTPTGTATWTASWPVPAVGVDTPADIVATAWAAGQSASRLITVTITP